MSNRTGSNRQKYGTCSDVPLLSPQSQLKPGSSEEAESLPQVGVLCLMLEPPHWRQKDSLNDLALKD